MADELSEDPRHWPQDPFELLGVAVGSSETDIKRAYTRLIRRFKPEHFPDQFRLIREAYEAALEGLTWRRHFTSSVPPPPVVSEFKPTAAESSEARTTEPEPADTPAQAEREPLHVPRDAVAEAWNLATSGRASEAYSRLIELSRITPDDPNIALRLYWLIAVYPAVDAERTRHDWLFAALKRSRFTGESITLYRRELEVNPDEALTGPYRVLLDVATAPSLLLIVARSRLTTAGRNRMWSVIDTDLGLLARRASEFDESGWLSYLVVAMGQLGFENPEPAATRCRELIAGLRHLQLRESWAFDQIDEQEGMTRLMQRGVKLPKAAREVVRDLWAGQTGEWRRAMTRASEWVRENPSAALQQFDIAADDQDAVPLLSIFNRLVTDLIQSGSAVDYPSGVIRGHVRLFLAQREFNYSAMRGDLLRLLLNEAIGPEEVMQACFVDPDHASRRLVEFLRNDPVFRLVWQTASLGSW